MTSRTRSHRYTAVATNRRSVAVLISLALALATLAQSAAAAPAHHRPTAVRIVRLVQPNGTPAPGYRKSALSTATVRSAALVGTHRGRQFTASGTWTSSRVVVHAYGIGSARYSMSKSQLKRATGATRFVRGEDGVTDTYGTPGLGVGSVYGGSTHGAFSCFFGVGGPRSPFIVTDRGAALGDTLNTLKALYGKQLHYTRGVESQVGRLPGRYVRTSRGTLFFYLQHGHVYSISALAPGSYLEPC